MAKAKSKLSVIINSNVAETLPLEYLTPLQGNLKDLPEASYERLKASILKHGFSFPVFVWEDESENKIYLIDGTQRYTTLNRMKDEGYSIPQIPVVMIIAKNLLDAKSKLAAAASQYGKFNEQGVKDFFKDFEVPEIQFADIPWLQNVEKTKEDFPQQTTTVKEHERNIDVNLEDFNKFEHQCPKCGHEWSDK